MQAFGWQVLQIDAQAEIDRIVRNLRLQMRHKLKRRGVVVGLSGGIDSSVCAALITRALGRERVFGLLMPEFESADESLELGREMAESLGIAWAIEPIGGILAAADCYGRRDRAIRRMDPQYADGDRCKIVIHRANGDEAFHFFSVVTQKSDGTSSSHRLDLKSYLEIVAAANFKQRTRKMLEYFHADRLNYAVCGTPNLLEYDQGFFVKHGDGAADFKPIAHLYKSQVYQLADALNVLPAIRSRPPTTDTYSLPQTQEEFYFSLPYREMDLCLYGFNHDIEPELVARILGLTAERVKSVYQEIISKRRATRYLHMPPLLVEERAQHSKSVELAFACNQLMV